MSLTPTQRADLKAARETEARLTPVSERHGAIVDGIKSTIRAIRTARNAGKLSYEDANAQLEPLKRARDAANDAWTPVYEELVDAEEMIDFLTSDTRAAERAEDAENERISQTWDAIQASRGSRT